MRKQFLLGVDIGTQGTKTSLVATDGQVVADAFEPSRLIQPGKGVVEQAPEDMYGSVVRTIAEVITKAGVPATSILAIGIDGQMAGIMGIDGDWNAVTPYDSWLDTRCEKYIKQIQAEAEEEVIRITGCPVTYAHGPKILWWKHERPEVYRKIAKFILPGVYVAGRLTGLKAGDAYVDYTYLHFSGFGDVEGTKWSEELLRLFRVEADKMPTIVEPWKVIGSLTREAAEQCHLLAGVPVVAGCGDSAATSLGAGITSAGLLFDIAGTASVFSCCVDQYQPDVQHKTLLFARSIIPGLWIPMAYINGGGMCLKWFRDHFTGGETGYAELDRETEAIPAGSEGLIFLPHFSGRVCPNDAYTRGTWVGLSWNHTRGHLYKAIMEGIAYEYRYYLKVLKGLVKGAQFTEVIAIGGGAKSSVFNAIKADVLGIKYNPQQISDTATLGTAMVAGYGVKVYPDLQQAAEGLVQQGKRIEPDPDNHAHYQKYANLYEEMFNALAPAFKALAE